MTWILRRRCTGWVAAPIVAALLALITPAAHAEPYFAVQQGLKCVVCHVNPSGGGMRNSFGNTWAQTVMPAHPIDLGNEEPWTGAVGRYLRIGANLRADATWVDVPHTDSQSEFDLSEARLYVGLEMVPERLELYLDQRIAPGGSSNLEAYGRFWLSEQRLYLQAGQMFLPYGLRLEDDGAFIRQATGINFATPDQGVEIGYEGTYTTAQLALSNGTAGGPEQDNGKQVSLRGEYVRASWRLGASFNFNDADAGERRMQGVFAGLRTGPIAWLGEADYIVDDSFADGRRNLWAGLIEADIRLAAGHNLKLTAEYLDPDDDVDEDEQNRYSVVYEWTPIQFLQLRVGARSYDGIPQNDLQNRTLAFAELNGFF